MTDEPDLIEQIRAVRRRLWEEHGGSVEGLCEWLKSLGAQHPQRLANPRPHHVTDEEIGEIVRMTGG